MTRGKGPGHVIDKEHMVHVLEAAKEGTGLSGTSHFDVIIFTNSENRKITHMFTL